MRKTPEEKLDAILTEHANVVKQNENPFQPDVLKVMAAEFRAQEENTYSFDREYGMLMDKLKNDKYIEFHERGVIIITIEGLMFIDSGGYTQQKINRNREHDRNALNEKRLVTYTVVLAFGTLLLVLAEVAIHWHEFRHFFLKHLF